MSCSIPTWTDQKTNYNISACHPTFCKSNPNNNQIQVNAHVVCALHKVTDVNHSGAAPSSNHGFDGSFRASFPGKKLFFNGCRTGNPSTPEATVAVWVLAQVLLVVVFSIVEHLSLSDVGGDGAKAML